MKFTLFLSIYGKFKLHFSSESNSIFPYLSIFFQSSHFPLFFCFFIVSYNRLLDVVCSFFFLFFKFRREAYFGIFCNSNVFQLVEMEVLTSMTKTFCLHLWNILILCTCNGWKYALSSNNLVWIYKFNHVNTNYGQKWNHEYVITMFSMHKMSSILHNLILKQVQTSSRKNNERNNLGPCLTSWFSKPQVFLLVPI